MRPVAIEPTGGWGGWAQRLYGALRLIDRWSRPRGIVVGLLSLCVSLLTSCYQAMDRPPLAWSPTPVIPRVIQQGG